MYKKSTIFYQIGIISGMWITDINYFRFPFLFDKLVKTQDQSLLLKSRYVLVSMISRMCVSCPGYIASHPTDNVHAMQGVRPFCGLISHFFPAKIPSCARVHFRNWPCHLVLWTVPSVTISISKPLFRQRITRRLHFHVEEKME